MFFVFEKDIQQASQDIRDAISAIRDHLPVEMKEPVLSRFDPSGPADRPALAHLDDARRAEPHAHRRSGTDEGAARDSGRGRGDGGGRRQARDDGGAQARRYAGGRRERGAVVAALQAQNLAAPVGRLNGPLDEQSIRLKGKLETPEDFLDARRRRAERRTDPAGRGGRRHSTARRSRVRGAVQRQATPSASRCKKSKGYSTTQVSAEVLKQVARDPARRCRPARKLDVVQDAGVRVERSVTNVEEALIEGALLTVLVVFLFLNSWRSTVITGLALPVSVLVGFIAVWAFGFTLNTMSLLGLSLAIGILIDDAIVVRENIVRHIEMGKDHFRAAHDGTDEIGLAVAATTFSIVAVFVPIAFMGDVAGPVVQAVRADDRLRGAGVALRLVLARPDALGVLARSADRGARAAESDRPDARPVQRLVRPAGRPVHAA